MIAAKLGLGVLLIRGAGADSTLNSFYPLAYASRGMAVLEALLGCGLVAAVVHGDLMVGTTAFWMTRPVSGVRLLAGKTMGLAVIFGVIPVALTLPWWIGCGYGVREIAMGAGETLLWQGLVVFAALPLATLTDGLARFLLWSVVVAGVIVGFGAQITGHPGMVAIAIAGGIFVTGCALSSAVYFFIRRYWASIAVLAGSVGLAFVALVWPWRFSIPEGWTGAERPGRIAPGVEFTFREARVRTRAGPDTDLHVWFKVKGVPPDLILGGGGTENIWSWPSPLVLKREGSLGEMDQGAIWTALGLSPPNEATDGIARTNAWRMQQGLPTWTGEDAQRLSTYALVPDGFRERVQKDPPSYQLRAVLELVRPVVLGEKPAKVGETLVSNTEVSRIASIRIDYRYKQGKAEVSSSRPPPLDPVTGSPLATRHRVLMALTEHGPNFLGIMKFSETDSKLSSSWPRREYFLINRERGNTTARGEGRGGTTKLFRVGTVAIVWRTLHFSPPIEYDAASKTWATQPGWLEKVTLAKLKFRTEERFTKEVRVDRFTIEPGDRPGGAR
ncbi:MAG TPA: hypothetical protein VHO24_03885 [Opitutaceae bacterium]|nr:hypothetical protein [Opitutaceae bacterium]